MRTAIAIGIVIGTLILGDVFLNDARMAHDVQHWFYKVMTGD